VKTFKNLHDFSLEELVKLALHSDDPTVVAAALALIDFREGCQGLSAFAVCLVATKNGMEEPKVEEMLKSQTSHPGWKKLPDEDIQEGAKQLYDRGAPLTWDYQLLETLCR